MSDRYKNEGIGASAAINATAVCRTCGSVVYDRVVHDQFHAGWSPVRSRSLDENCSVCNWLAATSKEANDE